MTPIRCLLPAFLLVCAPFCLAEEAPLPQAWDYVEAMKKVAEKSSGPEGVVLHIGDSITYSNPYGQWARGGKGKMPEDTAILSWMHCGANNETDGWFLARFDHPSGGRSHTAASGIRIDQVLRGGVRGMQSLAELLKKYRPQMVILMLGTNDASANRPLTAYETDMRRGVDLILGEGVICILSTIPPHPSRLQLAASYNESLRKLAKERGLPLIDFEKEILKRRPNDWNGTLLGRNDVHPTARSAGTGASSAPTSENLRNSGYLLRGWLSVKKIAEVKRTVVDGLPPRKPAAPSGDEVPTLAVKAPEGEKVRVEVSRDIWLSGYKEEADCNVGGATKLKVKSIQEMSILDVDPKPLKGRVINAVTLHLRGSGKEVLHRLTVSTVSSEWVEGTSGGYAKQNGSSCYNASRYPNQPWAFPGSNLNHVMLGMGGTIWRMADTFPRDRQGWQRVAVGPEILAARIAGISYGLLVFDDTGTELVRNGEQCTLRIFPNRFFHSRESGAKSAPYFTVFLGDEDADAPETPADLAAEVKGLPAGEAWVSWETPKDKGAAGTIGFHVKANGKDVPRYLIPPAGKPGEKVRMRLRDLALAPGGKVALAVRAVDGAGNEGKEASLSFAVAGYEDASLPGTRPTPFRGAGPLPKLGDAEVAIIDALDKVHPVTGDTIPSQSGGYLAANHLWSARDKRVHLYAARNEFVEFQVLFRGPVSGVAPTLAFGQDQKGIKESFYTFRHVESKKGPLPDPVVPLKGPFGVPAADESIPDQKFGTLLCEVYVPHDAAAGDLQGSLNLKAKGGSLSIPVTLTVWEFTLPDFLSFFPEMNAYGLPSNEGGYYRVAHLHRTVVNRLPYSQSGSVHGGCAPRWDGEKLNWAAWDARFSRYFDGSAFADLPRKNVPIEIFYLPLHENWPSPINKYYNGNAWADIAFPEKYRKDFIEVSRQYAEHFSEMGWDETLFHCYLNNKNNYKRRGWSRGSSPWILDEPANFQDYWALRYFGEAFHEGVNQVEGDARMLYRCDISRPQWQRNSLDHVLDYNVVGGSAFRRYHRMVMDRKEAFRQIVVNYGSTNAIEESNIQALGWCLDSWTIGSDGVLPWQTIGRSGSWKQADRLSIFYPGDVVGSNDPIPSIRLKAYRRGQQMAEYLTLLSQVTGKSRRVLGPTIRKTLRLAGTAGGTGFTGGEDAGIINYTDLRPHDVWALKVQIGKVLSQAKPEPKRKLIDFRTPRRDLASGSAGYVTVGEVPFTAGPAAAPKATVAKVVQGQNVVRDTIIDSKAPDQNAANVGRNNRIMRRDDCNAFLLRFDLAPLGIPKDAKIERATVSFYVWDPSSRGNSKVGAFPLKTAWEESAATWAAPKAGAKWKGGAGFAFDQDTGPAEKHIIVPPDQGRDTVNPPLEYKIEVTGMVREWASGKSPNYGVAIAAIIDRSVDEGQWTRFQVIASERDPVQYTPKLTVEIAE